MKFSIIIFYTLLSITAQSQERVPPKNTKLSYPAYDIVFKDFQVLNLDPQVIDDSNLRIKRNDFRISFKEDTQRVVINDSTDPDSYMHRIGDTGINVYTDTLLQVLKDSVGIEGNYDCSFYGKPKIIIPKKKGDRFQLSYSLTECVTEQINYRKIQDTALLARLEKNALHFTYNTKFKQIRDSAHFFFRFPDYPEISYDSLEKALKKKMQLGDTLVDLSSESDDIATLIYKNKPCRFDICDHIIKVERFSNGHLADRKFILIELTSGD